MPTSNSRDVFQAIADPTRRQIITMLAREPMNVNTIASHFDTTRQAISLHVRFLQDCGLVAIRQQGRERHCELKLEQLSTVTDWVNESRRIWMQQLQSLDTFLTQLEQNKPQASTHGKQE